jgi:hypothetical protein
MKSKVGYVQIVAVILLLFVSLRLLAEGAFEVYPFLHNINLIFHEAGHPIFSIFGRFMGSIGGMLGQLLIPLIFFAYFLREGKMFSAYFMSWWFGENFLDLAPYIADAQIKVLPILGGEGGHDFAYILGKMDMLHYDLFFGRVFSVTGAIIMAVSIVYMLTTALGTIESERNIINKS